MEPAPALHILAAVLIPALQAPASNILILALWIIAIVILAVVGFWLVAKMALPDPAALIARVIVGIICLLLLVGLFVPGLGIRLPGL